MTPLSITVSLALTFFFADAALARGERVDAVRDKAEHLREHARVFRRTSSHARGVTCFYRYSTVFVGVVVVGVLVLFACLGACVFSGRC